MSERLFCYGTLMFAEVMQKVTGRCFTGEPAMLHDYARYCIDREVYPGLIAEAGAITTGVLYSGIDVASMAKLDDFEGDAYQRIKVNVQVNERPVSAAVYCMAPGQERLSNRQPWQAEAFVQRHMQSYLHDV